LEESVMTDLTPRDRELVALGAAMGSNCVPCVEYHIPESRKAGLTDLEIHAAIQHADKIRQVPARKTLQAALRLLPAAADVRSAGTSESPACGAPKEIATPATSGTDQPRDLMMRMMSKMPACGGRGEPSSPSASVAEEPAAAPVTTEACGCG
jgi:4-carboxymuconolactone decarboxylase